ncbi:MAG: hypothetical protein OJF49_004620 [Ktedonobacterales bacterium]|nr:MAG: hypothetical protein OJF49_004620 [Ktedonobacterales bacterium]
MHLSLRRSAVLGLLLLFAIALSGCVHVERNVAINGDGSGTYTLTIGYSEQVVSLAADQSTKTMDDYGAKVKQEGGSYRHYDDTGYSYWAYTRPYKSVADLNKFITDMPQSSDTSGLTGTSGASQATNDSFTFSEQPGFFSNTFHVMGHISLVVPGDTSSNGVDLSSVMKDAHESFAVTMPGWVTSHSGGTVQGNTVTYLVHFGEQADIDVVGGGVNTAVIVPMVGGAILLLLLITGGVVFVMMRRRTRAAQPAPVAAYAGASISPSIPPSMPYTSSPTETTMPGGQPWSSNPSNPYDSNSSYPPPTQP